MYKNCQKAGNSLNIVNVDIRSNIWLNCPLPKNREICFLFFTGDRKLLFLTLKSECYVQLHKIRSYILIFEREKHGNN